MALVLWYMLRCIYDSFVQELPIVTVFLWEDFLLPLDTLEFIFFFLFASTVCVVNFVF